MTDLSTLLSMDAAILQRRIDNEKFALAAYQRQADLVNTILDHIDNGTIDAYCKERSDRIKRSIADIERMETVQNIRRMTT